MGSKRPDPNQTPGYRRMGDWTYKNVSENALFRVGDRVKGPGGLVGTVLGRGVHHLPSFPFGFENHYFVKWDTGGRTTLREAQLRGVSLCEQIADCETERTVFRRLGED